MEIGIVVLVLLVWVGAIALFFNRWGKIRMLLPYQPDYKQEQLKVQEYYILYYLTAHFTAHEWSWCLRQSDPVSVYRDKTNKDKTISMCYWRLTISGVMGALNQQTLLLFTVESNVEINYYVTGPYKGRLCLVIYYCVALAFTVIPTMIQLFNTMF